MTVRIDLADRFAGCLLGLAIGDALGSHFEGRSPESIAEQYRTAHALLTRPPRHPWRYTDDTEMAIGVAEALVARGHIEYEVLCERFAANYSPERGYGRGAQVILEAIQAGDDHRRLASEYLPGGSFGNGAAMRAAPIGMAFHRDLAKAWEQAHLSALPTHTHPLGIEGAQLIALAVALACDEAFTLERFFSNLLHHASHIEYAGPLRRAARVANSQDLALFGNGISATDSVVTAIAAFALTPDDYSETIANAILIGGDTDTIAAMAGAISGARGGATSIPARFLTALEDEGRGRSFLSDLAEKLHDAFCAA